VTECARAPVRDRWPLVDRGGGRSLNAPVRVLSAGLIGSRALLSSGGGGGGGGGGE